MAPFGGNVPILGGNAPSRGAPAPFSPAAASRGPPPAVALRGGAVSRAEPPQTPTAAPRDARDRVMAEPTPRCSLPPRCFVTSGATATNRTPFLSTRPRRAK